MLDDDESGLLVPPGNLPPLISEFNSQGDLYIYYVTMDENSSPVPFDLALNAVDPDEDPLSWSISIQAARGIATASATGNSSEIGYIPESDFHGVDSFLVEVTDGKGGYGTLIVSVTIRETGTGPDIGVQIGDTFSFVSSFVPTLKNTSSRGSAYITGYVPANAEVIGVRLINAGGETVAPARGGLYNDGYGPSARHDEYDAMGLEQGSMSAHYADTGIFYSSSSLTARIPDDTSITQMNGIEMDPEPNGANVLRSSGPPYYAHNAWDLTQMYAYGAKPGLVNNDGRGNIPYLYGSPVAGPQSHYPYEKVPTPACSDGINNDLDAFMDYPADPECATTLDDDETGASSAPVGPWQRIRYVGSEMYRRPNGLR